jgi:hypothetical protein
VCSVTVQKLLTVHLVNTIDAKRIISLSKTVVNVLENSVAHILITFTEFLYEIHAQNEGESNPVFSLVFYCQMEGGKWASSPCTLWISMTLKDERYTNMLQLQEHQKYSIGYRPMCLKQTYKYKTKINACSQLCHILADYFLRPLAHNHYLLLSIKKTIFLNCSIEP